MLRPSFKKVGIFIMLKKAIKGLRNVELIIAGCLFGAALIVLTLNVIFRRVPALPALDWAEEFMRYCSIWITFLGMAVCAEDDLHVGVDIVYQLSKTRTRKILKIICMALACVFCAFFTYACMKYVLMAYRNMQKSPVMLVPLWTIYTVLPIGAAISTIQYALKTVFYIRVNHEELADVKEDPADIDLLELS